MGAAVVEAGVTEGAAELDLGGDVVDAGAEDEEDDAAAVEDEDDEAADAEEEATKDEDADAEEEDADADAEDEDADPVTVAKLVNVLVCTAPKEEDVCVCVIVVSDVVAVDCEDNAEEKALLETGTGTTTTLPDCVVVAKDTDTTAVVTPDNVTLDNVTVDATTVAETPELVDAEDPVCGPTGEGATLLPLVALLYSKYVYDVTSDAGNVANALESTLNAFVVGAAQEAPQDVRVVVVRVVARGMIMAREVLEARGMVSCHLLENS